MRYLVCTILGLLGLLFFVSPSVAQEEKPKPATSEKIHRFDVDVTVREDGRFLIVETIDVTALNKKIKRGIYRDFPVVSQLGMGIRKTHNFDVQSVTRDGKREDFFVSEPDMNNSHARLYIGNEHVVLPKGRYVYQIEYITDRWLIHHPQQDELYWNVTGNYWEFPIDKVRCTVQFPKDFLSSDLAVDGWTGVDGEKGTNWQQIKGEPGQAIFESTKALAPYEGLTISVFFPTGSVSTEDSGSLWWDNLDTFLAIATLIIALFVYVVGWILVGKDPMPGAIVLENTPPEGVSPASARYLEQMGFDDQCISVALISAAGQGIISISETDGKFKITKEEFDRLEELPKDTRLLLENMMGDWNSLTFTKKNHSRIAKGVANFKKELSKQHLGNHFDINGWWTSFGIGASVVGLVLAVMANPNRGAALFFTLWLSIWSIGVIVLAASVFAAWKEFFVGTAGVLGRIGHLFGALFITAFATPFFVAEVVVLGVFGFTVSIYILVAVLLSVIMGWHFYHLMKCPTWEGRQLLDKVEGFRLWLEGDLVRSIDQAYSPEEAAELLDRWTAWAMALDLKQYWYDQLGEKVLAASRLNKSIGRNHGRDFLHHSALASTLGSAVSSSSVSPKSSGGSSSGGGSSGGGGGGGGGGGW